MRITSILTLCAIGAALPAAAATPQQFDLVCHNKTTTTGPDIKPIERQDEAHISVDLARKLWCRHKGAACITKRPIVDEKGEVLTLMSSSDPHGDNHTEVDLKSGAYSGLIHLRHGDLPQITSTATGTCTVADFTKAIL